MKKIARFAQLGFWVVVPFLIAPEVIAVTRSAESGSVKAEYSDEPGQACIENPRLKITREGQVGFDAVLSGEGLCRQDGDVFAIQDLDGDREPEVLLDFYSGGAHCCSSSLILRYDPESEQYTSMQHLWGEGQGATRRPDLDGDGTPEFVHYDSRFAYAFGSFADSGLPIRIWQYRNGEMLNVTRNYRQQVYDDAFKWWQRYTEAKQQGSEVKGILAAYLADKYLLNEAEDGWQRLEQIYQAEDRQQFFGKLREFLVETGYTTTAQSTQPRRPSLVRRPTESPVPPSSVAPTERTPTEQSERVLVLEEQNSLAQGDEILQIDQTLYDQYDFEGQAGQQVVITLESTDFDPYLILVDPNQTIIAENDDATTSSQNAELTVTLPQNGTYTVVANSYQPDGQGNYTLTVTSEPILNSNQANTDSELENTSESTAEVTPSSTSSSEFGTVEGTLSYPADEIPPLTLCAQSTQNYYLLSCIKTAANQRTFRLTLRPGEYYIFSHRVEALPNSTAGDVRDAFVYYTQPNTSSTPRPVRVIAGKTISNISLQNTSVCNPSTSAPEYCVRPHSQ